MEIKRKDKVTWPVRMALIHTVKDYGSKGENLKGKLMSDLREGAL